MNAYKPTGDIIPLLEESCGDNLENYDIFVDGDVSKNGSMAEWILISLIHKSTKKELHLVVKQTVTANLTTTKALMDVTYFNEIYFYKTLWAELGKFQKSYPGTTPCNKIPIYYASSSVPGKEKLVLENLRQSGFRMFPRNGIYDDEHIKFLLKSYGHFHGISAAYREINPEKFKELSSRIRDNALECLINVDVMNELLMEVMRRFRETVTDPKMQEKMKTVCEKPLQVMLDSFKYNGKNPIINHGDAWSNNMMFKYDKDGKLLDFRMLDFQLFRCGSVVLDLSYLIYCGVDKQVYDNFDYYLKIYHDSFSDTIRSFNLNPSEVFTFQDLKNEWKDHMGYGFVMSQIILRSKFTTSTEKLTVVELAEKPKSQHSMDALKNFGDQEDPPEVKQKCFDMANHLIENHFL